MNRRSLLGSLAAAGALSTAGCVSGGSPADGAETDGPTETAEPTDEPTDSGGATDTPGDASTATPGETATGEPCIVVDQSLTVLERGCGTAADEAAVSFDGDGETVAVTGTIWGNDACHTAILSDVRLDDESLEVVVTTESDAEPDQGCAECISEIEYEATVAFDNGLPDEVTVVHEHGEETTQVTSTHR